MLLSITRAPTARGSLTRVLARSQADTLLELFLPDAFARDEWFLALNGARSAPLPAVLPSERRAVRAERGLATAGGVLDALTSATTATSATSAASAASTTSASASASASAGGARTSWSLGGDVPTPESSVGSRPGSMRLSETRDSLGPLVSLSGDARRPSGDESGSSDAVRARFVSLRRRSSCESMSCSGGASSSATTASEQRDKSTSSMSVSLSQSSSRRSRDERSSERSSDLDSGSQQSAAAERRQRRREARRERRKSRKASSVAESSAPLERASSVKEAKPSDSPATRPRTNTIDASPFAPMPQQEAAPLWPEGLDSLIFKLPPPERSEMLQLYRRKSIVEDQLPASAKDSSAPPPSDERTYTLRRQLAEIDSRIGELTVKAHKAGGNKVNIVGASGDKPRKFSGLKKFFGSK